MRFLDSCRFSLQERGLAGAQGSGADLVVARAAEWMDGAVERCVQGASGGGAASGPGGRGQERAEQGEGGERRG